MAKWTPCKRRDFIAKLRKIGFGEPEPGACHFYMRRGTFTLILPNNAEYSIPQVKMLLKEIEIKEQKAKKITSLRGIWRGVQINEEDIEKAKHIWDKGVENEVKVLEEETGA